MLTKFAPYFCSIWNFELENCLLKVWSSDDAFNTTHFTYNVLLMFASVASTVDQLSTAHIFLFSTGSVATLIL